MSRMPRQSAILPFICAFLVFIGLISAQGVPAHVVSTSEPIGITEKIGQTISPQLTFLDEQGTALALGGIINKPTILVLVYYTCDRFCPQMLAGLARVLPQVPLEAGKDYQVMTVSFDDSDTPATARDIKRNYLKAIGRPFPADAWRFLTGDHLNIEQLCAAAGFAFRKEEHGFAHPVALIIVSPQRLITRYIHVSKFFYGVEYPITFSAVDLSQALADAAKGKVGVSTRRDFLFCFPHEPYRQETFYRILAWIGAGTVIGLAVFFVYLSLSGRKPRKGKSA
jgi:protein SCO1/2